MFWLSFSPVPERAMIWLLTHPYSKVLSLLLLLLLLCCPIVFNFALWLLFGIQSNPNQPNQTKRNPIQHNPIQDKLIYKSYKEIQMVQIITNNLNNTNGHKRHKKKHTGSPNCDTRAPNWDTGEPNWGDLSAKLKSNYISTLETHSTFWSNGNPLDKAHSTFTSNGRRALHKKRLNPTPSINKNTGVHNKCVRWATKANQGIQTSSQRDRKESKGSRKEIANR